MRIAFCGRAGSGKSTLADFLVEKYGFVKYSFAAAVKELCVEMFPDIMALPKSEHRWLLQKVGTDWFRGVDDNVWIYYLMNRIIAEGFEDVVVDDARFLNEVHSLKANGFIIVKLEGRAWKMTREQMAHPSEIDIDRIESDYIIDTLKPLQENYWDIEKLVLRHKLDDLRMLAEYYKKAEGKSNKNYQRGRDFEYRVMRLLRKRGWHCMRKFGSHDDIWKIDGEKIHVPVDVTAYKNGVYLIISCKYSIKGPTTYLDDPKRDNLIRYCRQYGPKCIPVMACVNEQRHAYLIDLRDYSTMGMLRMSKRGPKGKKADEASMARLLKEAWEFLDILKYEYKTAKETKDDIRRVAWASEIVKHINIINRLLKSAGETAGSDDITTLIEQLGEEIDG